MKLLPSVIHDTVRHQVEIEPFGAVKITRKADGATIYFQPGDDADHMMQEIKFAAKSARRMFNWGIDDAISDYDGLFSKEEN